MKRMYVYVLDDKGRNVVAAVSAALRGKVPGLQLLSFDREDVLIETFLATDPASRPLVIVADGRKREAVEETLKAKLGESGKGVLIVPIFLLELDWLHAHMQSRLPS